jgi:hypothetical protein
MIDTYRSADSRFFCGVLGSYLITATEQFPGLVVENLDATCSSGLYIYEYLHRKWICALFRVYCPLFCLSKNQLLMLRVPCPSTFWVSDNFNVMPN